MILGVDPGEVRYGVAVGDLETRTATPLEVIDARSVDPVDRLKELIGEMGVTLIVVGKPLSLSGEAGRAVETQRDFLSRLRDVLDTEIVEVDERLSTVIADRSLRAAGIDQRKARKTRDALAAQVILQSYLDAQPRAAS